MVYLPDETIDSIGRVLHKHFGKQEPAEGWRAQVYEWLFSYIEDYALDHPDKPPLLPSEAWDRMSVTLRALGADV